MFLTDYGFISPEEGLELENRLLSEEKNGLIIYSRDRPRVSLGRFNPIDDHVDVSFAKKNNISWFYANFKTSALFGQFT